MSMVYNLVRDLVRPLIREIFDDLGSGVGVDNLLLETGFDLLLETDYPDTLILE